MRFHLHKWKYERGRRVCSRCDPPRVQQRCFDGGWEDVPRGPDVGKCVACGMVNDLSERLFCKWCGAEL